MRQLILRITAKSGGEAGYRCELLAGDGEDAWTTGPLATDELASPLQLPAAPAGQTWPGLTELRELLGGAAPKNQFVVPDAGHAVASLLEGGNLAAAWASELKTAWKAKGKATPASLRLVFSIEPPELQSLPWELLRPAAGAAVAMREWMPVSRRYGSEQPAQAIEKIVEPLRLLIVVGCAKNDADVRWQEELHQILVVAAPQMHEVDFELFITHRYRKIELVQRLRETLDNFQPHVLHFIGHGRAKTPQSQASLSLWDETSDDVNQHGVKAWGVTDIVTAIGKSQPRVVVLNACRSAAFGSSAGVYGFAAALMDAGVAAVIGMQGDIPGKSAASFAAGLYASLLSGNAIDVAVTDGRKAIAGVSTDGDRDWAMPALVTAVPIDEVLPIATRARPQPTLSVNSFADRREHRRTLRHRAESAAANAEALGVLIVRGEESMGKTALVKTALEGCALRGRRVRYVSFDGQDSMDIIQVLRHIRGPHPKAESSALVERSLYREFGRFNDALVALLSGRKPAEKPGTGEDDPSLVYSEGGTAHEQTIELALDAFRVCLVAATAKEPLVIALDQLGKPNEGKGISRECFTAPTKSLITDLLVPIRDRKAALVGDVRCIVCATPTQEKQFALDTLGPALGSCDVAPFPSEDFDLIAREYLMQKFAVRNFTAAEMVEFVDGWSRIMLRQSQFPPRTLDVFGLQMEEVAKAVARP
ncbi:MAG: CHAT domain-containing protein [bacterium]